MECNFGSCRQRQEITTISCVSHRMYIDCVPIDLVPILHESYADSLGHAAE